MALQTLGLVVLAQNYKDGLVSQINRNSVLLKMLPVDIGGGLNVAWTVALDGMSAFSYPEGADMTTPVSDAQTAAILNWAEYAQVFGISGLLQAASASSGAGTAKANLRLWVQNMMNAASSISSKLNKDLYTGTGATRSLVGLDAAIGSVTNTYASIDRTVTPLWQPNLFNAAGPASAITWAQIRSDLQAIYIASGARPDIAMVSPQLLQTIATIADPYKQYLFSTIRDVKSARDEIFHIEGGIGAISFDGCQFIEDKDCPTGKIYYLSSDNVHLEILPVNYADLPGMTYDVEKVVANDGYGPISDLGYTVESLAHTGDANKAFMKAYLQLKVMRPNACGVRMNIS